MTYKYDERGRLTKVSRSGTVNNGVTACYAYDKADNRTNVTVASSDCNATPPAFSINDVSVTEGGNLVFTVTKAGATSSSFSVNFATANGSASSGSDYTANSGTLTFAATDTTKTITIVTADDASVESAETVLVNLSGPTGGSTIGDSQGIGTINDNDAAPTCAGVSFTIASNAAVTEGANSVFTVSRAGSTTNSCSVNFATANGSAAAGSDYTSTSGTLTFSSAQTSQSVSVPTIDDTAVEGGENFSLSLSSPTGGSVVGTPGSATATINDNDSAPGPSFSINDAGATEGFQAVFTITRTGSTSTSHTVSYATSDISATAGVDYGSVSSSITFAAGQVTKTVSIQTFGDQDFIEADETFSVTLTGATGGGVIGDGSGLGTIFNDPGQQGCFDPESGIPIPCDFLLAPPPMNEESSTSAGEEK